MRVGKLFLLPAIGALNVFGRATAARTPPDWHTIRHRGNGYDPERYIPPPTICNYVDPHVASPEERARAWNETGTGAWLDAWLLRHGEEDWVVKLDDFLFQTGTSTLDCTTLEGNCPPPEHGDCLDRFADVGYPEAYWIYYSVAQAFITFQHMHEMLQDAFDSVEMWAPSITSDFDEDEKQNMKEIAYIQNSLAIASGIAGAAGAVAGIANPASPLVGQIAGIYGAGTSIINGVLGIVQKATEKEEDVDSNGSIADQLHRQFNNIMNSVPVEMEAFFAGGKEAGDKQAAWDGMDVYREQHMGNFYQTSTANYFSYGRFLITDVGDDMKQWVIEFERLLLIGILNTVLKQNRYVVLANRDKESAEDCRYKMNKPRLWVDNFWSTGGGGLCLELYKYLWSDHNHADDVDEKRVKKLWTKYKHWPQVLLLESFRCALQHPDGTGKIDVNDADLFEWREPVFHYTERPKDASRPPRQQLPLCFWSLPVTVGTRDGSKIKVMKGDLNTSPYPVESD